MKTKYKGYLIEVIRKSKDAVPFGSVFDENGVEIMSGYSLDDDATVREYLEYLKEEVDDLIKTPEEDVDDYILNWISCCLDKDDENYENCCECSKREECLERASDSHRGNIMFEDSILSGGFDSMDEFWESVL